MTTQPATPQPQDSPEQRVSKLEGINEQILEQLREWRADMREWRADSREQFAENRADHERLRADQEHFRSETRAEFVRLDAKIDSLSNRLTVMMGLTLVTIIGGLVSMAAFAS